MKKVLLVAIVLAIVASSVFALVACGPSDPNAFYDALANAKKFTFYTYDADGNESVQLSMNSNGEFCFPALSVYAIKEGDKMAVYANVTLAGWTKTLISVDSEAYKNYMKKIEDNKSNFSSDSKFVNDDNGMWFLEGDTIKTTGAIIEGGKLVFYTKTGEEYVKTMAMKLKADIKLPDEAKKIK